MEAINRLSIVLAFTPDGKMVITDKLNEDGKTQKDVFSSKVLTLEDILQSPRETVKEQAITRIDSLVNPSSYNNEYVRAKTSSAHFLGEYRSDILSALMCGIQKVREYRKPNDTLFEVPTPSVPSGWANNLQLYFLALSTHLDPNKWEEVSIVSIPELYECVTKGDESDKYSISPTLKSIVLNPKALQCVIGFSSGLESIYDKKEIGTTVFKK